MDKISVIVPIYNAEKYLDKCLTSLVSQTYTNLEIILINDGSTDNSLNIIEKFAKEYKNTIKVISRKNKGIGYSRNEGIRNASGSYISFVDSDDYLEINMLEEMYKKIKKYDADIIICNYEMYNNSFCKEVDVTKTMQEETSLFKQPELMNTLNFAPWNKLYKKELFNGIVFPEKYKFEDLSAVFKVCLNAKKIVKLDKTLYNYYVNASGETGSIDYRNLDMYYIIKDIIKYSKKYDNNQSFWNAFSLFCTYRIYEVLGNTMDFDDRNKIIDYIKKSITLLNENFSNWKANLQVKGIKRIILTNKFLCTLYLKKRRRK